MKADFRLSDETSLSAITLTGTGGASTDSSATKAKKKSK